MVNCATCAICGHEMMEIKPGHWACPGFYGSPMHFCCPVISFGHGDPAKREEGERMARARLEKYCGCTLEEYLAASERLTESLLQEQLKEQNSLG